MYSTARLFLFLNVDMSPLPLYLNCSSCPPCALWTRELCVMFHWCPVEALRLGSLKRKTSICSKGIPPSLVISNQTSLAERALFCYKQKKNSIWSNLLTMLKSVYSDISLSTYNQKKTLVRIFFSLYLPDCLFLIISELGDCCCGLCLPEEYAQWWLYFHTLA